MTTDIATKYEVIIGLEVHAQLTTKSKMFCRCSADYAASPPNTHVCPVCLGMPGVLPVINRQAVEYVVMTALALNCTIPEQSKFDRKNYPYPDLMKGYQISQYDLPLGRDGWLEIEVDGTSKRIGISDVHLEEDTARSVHRTNEAGEDYSLIDVSRSGTPLMEIVSKPDMRSAEEARQYVTKLQQIFRYLGVSNANMEEGAMRCEPSVSLRPAGSKDFGTRVEVKNINSFRAVYRALEFEIERQIKVLESGAQVTHETRGWREELGGTVPQRTKEYADDYRYFPEPDLLPLTFSRQHVEELRARLPELPDAKRQRLADHYGLGGYEAGLLSETRARGDYFEAAVEAARNESVDVLQKRAKAVANWMVGDFARLLNAAGIDITQIKVAPRHLYDMILLVEDSSISGTIAKAVFEEMFSTGKPPRQVIEERGLTLISGADELSGVIEKVIAANEKAVADYRSGKPEALKFLIGQAMRETRGRASPGVVQELLKSRLEAT